MKAVLMLLFFLPVVCVAQVKSDGSLAGKKLNEIEEMIAGDWYVTKIKIDTADGFEERFTDVQYQFSPDKKSRLVVFTLGRPTVSEGSWKVSKEGENYYLTFNMEWGTTRHMILFVDDSNLEFHETREGWNVGNIYVLQK